MPSIEKSCNELGCFGVSLAPDDPRKKRWSTRVTRVGVSNCFDIWEFRVAMRVAARKFLIESLRSRVDGGNKIFSDPQWRPAKRGAMIDIDTGVG